MTDRLHTVFDWQQQQWRQFIKMIRAQRLPHAMLLSGVQGIGKQRLAVALAHFLQCGMMHKGDHPCGQCKACQLNQAGTHPDFQLVAPSAGTKVIKVSQVRELIDWASKTAQIGLHRVVLIYPGEAMNASASNALLKCLEEPGNNLYFIIVTHSVSQIMPTIRSRCQLVKLLRPPQSQSLEWLKSLSTDIDVQSLLNSACGAPLQAAALIKTGVIKHRADLVQALIATRQARLSPTQAAKRCEVIPLEQLFDWLLTWSNDWLKLASGVSTDYILNQDLLESWHEILGMVSVKEVLNFQEYLLVTKQSLNSTNLNQLLLLETLFIRWHYGECAAA